MEGDPINFYQAMQDSNSQKWIDVMNEEYKSIQDNQVWDLVPLPESKKPIGCKWIFKTKRDSEGNVERYKSLGFMQNFLIIGSKEYVINIQN